MWAEAGLSWSDFLPDDVDINKFVTEQVCEVLSHYCYMVISIYYDFADHLFTIPISIDINHIDIYAQSLWLIFAVTFLWTSRMLFFLMWFNDIRWKSDY